MKNYVRVADGVVVEVIPGASYEAPADELKDSMSPEVWDLLSGRVGSEIPIEQRFTPEFVSKLVDISELNPLPVPGMSYLDGQFLAPEGPKPEVIAIANKGMRDSLLSVATLAIDPLQDAVDLGGPTEAEVALLMMWKEYRRDVNRVDLTQMAPQWPSQPT